MLAREAKQTKVATKLRLMPISANPTVIHRDSRFLTRPQSLSRDELSRTPSKPLRVPHGEWGKVINVKVFSGNDLSAGVNQLVQVWVAQKRRNAVGDKLAGRHGNKGVVSIIAPVEEMPFLPDGTPVDIILNPLGVPGRMNIGQVLETHLGWASSRLGFRAITPVFDGATEVEIEAELARAWMIDQSWKETGEDAWAWLQEYEYEPEMIQDDNEVRRLYMEAWLGDRGYNVYQLISDLSYARRSVLREWLRDRDYDPDQMLYFGLSEDEIVAEDLPRLELDQNAINACLKLWLQEMGENVAKLNDEKLRDKAESIMLKTGVPTPILGKQVLRDGKTGEPYDQPVTVGVMTMLKLHHLVEDKVHARSTGPYSLVSQQPLGGKAQFGGQRFGEMEVWALEAYGAAYTLQEMLTVKSDDVQGRVKTYEAIVKGEPIEEPSIPAAFRVLVKELQSLGLAVEAVSDTGDLVKFGKDDERSRPPRLATGLLGLGDNF